MENEKKGPKKTSITICLGSMSDGTNKIIFDPPINLTVDGVITESYFGKRMFAYESGTFVEILPVPTNEKKN